MYPIALRSDRSVGRVAAGDCSRCYDAAVQLRLPWTTPPAGARTIDAGGRTFPVQVVRHRRARRYILRVTATGTVRVTVPGRASIAGALAFASAQADWIVTEWTRRHSRGAWEHGTRVWYRGDQHALSCTRSEITCGTSVVPRPDLEAPVRGLLQAAWRAEAALELPSRCLALGAPHGLQPGRIQIRNQQSRWGSCSSRGNVALNWRLIQMPPDVADYVMLHELVHLEHPNHSSRFWRRVAAVCPGWRSAERWLRVSGRDLL